MKRLLGPILYAGDVDDATWRAHLGLLVEGGAANSCPVALELEGGAADAPVVAADLRGIGRGVLWRWSLTAQRAKRETSLRYRFRPVGAAVEALPSEWFERVLVPAADALPRIAFFSCNGFSDEKVARNEPRPNALWNGLWMDHRATRARSLQDPKPGFHLLVGGGDQIYCDELWRRSAWLRAYEMASQDEMVAWKKPAKPADLRVLEDELLGQYVDLYAERFSKEPFASCLARIPTAFTWDDHDIFDGWGSYPKRLQQSDLFDVVFGAARRAYEAFQLGGSPPLARRVGSGGHSLQALSFQAGDRLLDLVLLDLRGERTLEAVLSKEQVRDLARWLDTREKAITAARRLRRHLVVVSSVPMIYLRFSSAIEELTTGLRVFHSFRIDDDMRDQWESELHRGERASIVSRLFAHARATGSRATVVSGDVHVGSRGRFVSRDPTHVLGQEPYAYIEQITASGIVHPPPGRFAFAGMNVAGDSDATEIGPFVTSEIRSIGGREFLRERNFVVFAFDDGPPSAEGAAGRLRLWAQWRAESGRVPEQAVIEAG